MSEALTSHNPTFEHDVRASFGRQGLMGALGAWMTEVSPGRVVIELPYSPRLSQQRGHFHGAVVGAIADNAAGYAAFTMMPAGSDIVTVEYKINFVRPAAGDLLRAIGEVVKPGKSLTIARAEVLCRTASGEATCAVLLSTLMRIEPGPDAAA